MAKVKIATDVEKNGARKETLRPEKPTRPSKSAITVRISDELMTALQHHQAEVRSKPGARRGDTTIGGVMEHLLRQSLKMESL